MGLSKANQIIIRDLVRETEQAFREIALAGTLKERKRKAVIYSDSLRGVVLKEFEMVELRPPYRVSPFEEGGKF